MKPNTVHINDGLPEDMRFRRRFVSEGVFVAMPLCFPSVSEPLAPESSRITALDVASHGMIVYGGTSGEQSYLIQAAPKGDAGYVVNLGAVPGANRAVAVFDLGECVVGCFHGPGGSRVVRAGVYGRPITGLQEWSFRKSDMADLAMFENDCIASAVMDGDGLHVVCALTDRVVQVSVADGRVTTVRGAAPAPGCGLVRANDGAVCILTRDGSLGRMQTQGGELALGSAADAGLQSGRLLGALEDGGLLGCLADGAVVRIDPASGESVRLAEVPVPPVQCAACCGSGRVYLFYGDGISRFGRLNSGGGGFEDLGVAASALNVKRYGYAFACAATGHGGEMYFGENDRGGHLWMYLPPLRLP